MIRTVAAGALLAALLAPSASWAQSKAQYRQLTLSDGRTLVAEVLSTEDTGLLMRTPQGDALVSFELLLDMVPTEAAAYTAQPAWSVQVAAPDDVRPQLLEVMSKMPGLDVRPLGEGDLTAEQTSQLRECGMDPDCIAYALEGPQWRWVVVALPADGGIRLVSAVTSGPTRQRVDVADTSRESLWTAVHQVLLLEPPSGGPPKVAKTPTAPKPDKTPTQPSDKEPLTPGPVASRGAFDEQRVIAMSFAPLPGLPSLRQGDGAGFAAAMGIALPATALWVGAVGQNAQSVGETAAIGAAGFYAATVLANQVTGLGSLKKARRADDHLPLR